MDDLQKLKMLRDEYTLKIIQTESKYNEIYATFFSEMDVGKSKETLLKEYKEIFEKRKELDEDVTLVQSYLAQIIGDIENAKLSKIDRIRHHLKVKAMVRKLDKQLVFEGDEKQEVVEVESENE